MSLECLIPVARATWVVLAAWSQQGRHRDLISAHRSHQHEPRRHCHGSYPSRRDGHDRALSRADARALTTSRRSESKFTCAAAGSARTNTRLPSGTVANSALTIARRRRLTLLRTTAPPIALETAKPAMREASPVSATDTTTVVRPLFRPLLRTNAKSAAERMRDRASSTSPRPRSCRDPCGDERPGSSDQRAYACADGSRASWRACGCWAGKSACSRVTPHVLGGSQISALTLRPARLGVKSPQPTLATPAEQDRLHHHSDVCRERHADRQVTSR